MAKMTFEEYKALAANLTENIAYANKFLWEIHMGREDASLKDFYINSVESNTVLLKSLKEQYEEGLAMA